MTTKTLPSGTGIVSSYAYDNADRLTGIDHVKDGTTTLASVAYTLDDVGNRTQRVDQQGTHTYAYDDVYRLTSVTYPGPATTSYTFDAFGNRTSMTDASGTTDYTYDDADRLTTVDPPGAPPAVTYTWDDNGNLTNRGSDTFAWDYEDRLTSATVNSTTTTFAYRGDGLRDSRTTGGNTTTFTWDIAAGLPVVIDDGSQYVYGAGLEEMITGGNTYYYLADGLGSTMAIVDAAGAVQKSYTYDVYGKPTTTGTLANEFDFAGQQTDPTGFQYLRARYMDPATGTFLGRDPLASAVPWVGHPAGYARGNPVVLTDPLGLCPRFTPQKLCDVGSAGKNKAGDLAKDTYHAGRDTVASVGSAAEQTWKLTAPALAQCAVWGAAGAALGGGVQGAAAGCAAGVGSYVLDQYLGSNPLSQCVNWGTAGAVTAGLVGAAAGCAAGAASWVDSKYGPGDRYSECGVWGSAGGATAGAPGFALGCLAGAASTDVAGWFHDDGSGSQTSPSKEKP